MGASSRSTLFVQVSVLVCQSEMVKIGACLIKVNFHFFPFNGI